MQYLIATYWMWFVVALLVGCAVGYWLRWRLGPHGGSSQVLRWGAAAFLIGLVVAVLYWLPRRAGLYLETLLLLSFWYAIGGLLGALLRAWTSGAEASGKVRIGNLPPEAAALAERARVAVRSTQADAPASSGSIEDARLAVEARAADVTRVAAAAKAAEEDRVAAAAKAAAKARVDAVAKAAEDARLAVEAKAAELARIAAAAKVADEARLAAKAKAAEEARAAAVAKAVAKAADDAAADDARRAAEAKAAEEARAAASAKAADDARVAAEAKAVEDARLAAAAKAAEETRLADDAKAAEDARLAAEARTATKTATKTAKRTATKTAKSAREAAAEAANAPAVAARATAAAEAASHPGSQPPGIAAPADGEADDLKLIKGIGPKNEKACHALGVYRFGQIADWTPDEASWVGHHMAFPGRIEREHWSVQARLLASGGETEHSRAVKSGSLVVDDSADEPLDQAAADMLAKSIPAPAAAVEGEDKHAGRRPYGFANAVGAADDLKKIRGIGPQNERRLHALGIWHFSQIAAWSEDNVKWVGSYLAFAGRIDREKWIAQARDLAAGKETEFSRRVAAGKVATSKDDGASG